jgi:hypothetical protein
MQQRAIARATADFPVAKTPAASSTAGSVKQMNRRAFESKAKAARSLR